MTQDRVVSIYTLSNAFIKNTRTGSIYTKQKVMCIEFANGKVRHLDLKNGLDITDVDFLELYIQKGVTKLKKNIFDEINSES